MDLFYIIALLFNQNQIKMRQSNKFIVVDTWNGEGYSSENGIEIKIFDTKKEADAYCKIEAYKNEVEDVMQIEKVV